MRTTVLGVRLTDNIRDKIRSIGLDNRMGEVEVARLILESAAKGEITVSKGHVNGSDMSGIERLAQKHGKTVQEMLDMIAEIE